MKTVVLNIHDESKTYLLLGLLRDLRYVEICELVQQSSDGEIWWADLPKAFIQRIDQSLKTVFDIQI